MTFNQTVVGSNPATLTINKQSFQILQQKSININFYWLFLYNYLFLKTLNSFIYTPQSFRRLLICQNQLKLNKSLSYKPNGDVNLWSTQVTKLNYELIDEDCPVLTTPKLLPISMKLNTKLFILYLSTSNGVSSTVTHIHGHFRSLFLGSQNKHGYPYINVSKLLHRWIHTHTLLYNLFYNQTPIIVFSSKVLQKEAYAVNWDGNSTTYNLFKYSIPCFFLKNHPFGLETNIAFSRLADFDLECVFITDLRYHYRSVAFLKKHGMYTIGLVPYNTSPWSLHYPIPVAVSTIFIQYFFIKLLFYLRNSAFFDYYKQLIKLTYRLT